MEFEWDTAKSVSNHSKHGVSFPDAATVFGDARAITFPDPDHSEHEDRFPTFGRSEKSTLLVVSHTDREGRTRIIGARRASRKERTI